MELWGGVECTVNRVGHRFRDQTRATGHHDRIDDLQRFAALGLTALRYPLLWERVAPDRPDEHDWRWTDERLPEIARLGMRPIAGLVHHGSGPAYTDLLDDRFPALLADFAGAAAARYPWVEDWTPVNEPLTTARFSALYGVWYPHARDEALFWRALFNQVDAIRLSMRAIRRVNPVARLIQTEDLGRCYATAALGREAAYNNARRWATWDLLTGRVGPEHPLWPDWERLGLGDRARAMADDPCPPDIVGVNHYVTSDRFLDGRVDRYALPTPPDCYHDLTAARVMDPAPPGLTGALSEAWERYGLPLAVTESHLGCTREEQLRWLHQSWTEATALASAGVDLRAFTAWALNGNVDWSELLAVERGQYEPGAFDVRGPAPRPTALAGLVGELAAGREPAHPVLAGAGWWRRDVRLEHSVFAWGEPVPVVVAPPERPRPLLITGATGTLGQAIAGACRLRGLEHRLLTRAELPIDDPDAIAAMLDATQPWAVVNAAGWVRVDDAEGDEAGCLLANAQGGIDLARACAERGIHCTLFSSDLVFNGRKGAAYDEGDLPNPLGAYGRSKAVLELAVLAEWPETLIVRTAAFFAPYDQHNFAMAVERTLRAGRRFLASDTVVTPTYVPDLVSACLDLAIDGEGGLWHLASGEALSWVAFGRRVAHALGLDSRLVVPAGASDLGWRATRPGQVALGTARGQLLPPLDDAIARHAAVRRADLAARAPAAQAA